MKLIVLSALVLAASPALANETADACRSYVAENGGDASGCDCLGEAASKDPKLAEAISGVKSPADLEALDDSAKEAIRACFPEA
jgi:hypothetical protein